MRSYEYVLFLVDDNLFVRDFELRKIEQSLVHHPNALGFSLRLGKNIRYNYMRNVREQRPAFRNTEHGFLIFNWAKAKRSFAYALEVSSSFYRTNDLYPMLEQIPFNNPNTLEAQMARCLKRFLPHQPFLICARQTITFCNPVNKVQTISPRNRSGKYAMYSSSGLRDLFDQGYRIDVGRYAHFIPNACHQEVELRFISTNLTTPTISIVICCYNYGRYLPQAIDSCLASTLKNIEIIVVDDGSTDPYTMQVLQALDKPNTRVIFQSNKGASSARNTGIRNARAEYIFILDADDMIHRSMLEKSFAVLMRRPEVGFVGSWAKCFGIRNRVMKFPPYNPYLILVNNMISSGAMFRKKAWEQVGGFNERMRNAEDWDFWISLSKKGWWGYVIPQPLWYYRRHGANKSKETFRKRRSVRQQIVSNHPELFTPAKLAELRHRWLPIRLKARYGKRAAAMGVRKQFRRKHAVRLRKRVLVRRRPVIKRRGPLGSQRKHRRYKGGICR